MKILALRGRNLASLGGEFAIDFEAAPLAHAGLFAITGPTGAGKSTLLDALCLALYDRVPRLTLANRGEIGRAGDERLGADDVRNVLRHGVAEGFAEVEFIGRDGGRYRARWEVRRARSRVTGRLQAQTVSLLDLATGGALGTGKREVLDLIRDRIGLDYDQFRRSVLLAQNEFDAFLRARPAERAELLELMTGTSIYGALSVAAFDRCRQEKATLDFIEADLQRVNVLGDDERTVVATDAAAAGDAMARLDGEVAALTRETTWYRVTDDIAARIAEAETQADAARAAMIAAQPERDRIAAIGKALSAAPLVAKADRLAAELARLGGQETEIRAVVAAKGADRDRLRATMQTAQQAQERAETALRAAAPLLARAADLDTRIAEIRQRAEACGKAARTGEELTAQAGATLDLLGREQAACHARITSLEQWLTRHQGREALSGQLDRWLAAIAEYRRIAATRSQAAAHGRALGAELADRDAQWVAGLSRRQDIDAALATADATMTSRGDEAAATDLGQLEDARQSLGKHDEALRRLDAELRQARNLADRDCHIAQRRQAAEDRQAAARDVIAEIAPARGQLDAALAEARRALALVATGEAAAALRRHLVGGEPCPVCGSCDHPLANLPTALLADQTTRVAELEAQQTTMTRRWEEARAALNGATEMLALTATDAARVEAEKAANRARWQDAADAAGLDLPADPFAAESSVLAAARSRCDRETASIATALRRAHQLHADLREVAAQRDTLRGERQQVADGLAEIAGQIATATERRDRALIDTERAGHDLGSLADSLAAPLAAIAGWRDMLAAEDDALAGTCRALAEEWRGSRDALDKQRNAERGLASKVESARAAHGNARHNAERAAAALAVEAGALAELRLARTALFDGQPIAAIRTGLEQAQEQARAGQRKAHEDWAATDRACGIAETQLRDLAERHVSTQAAGAEAVDERDRFLVQAGLELSAVRRDIAQGDVWLQAANERQRQLRDEETTAKAILDERRNALATHQEAGRPTHGREELAALLPIGVAARDQARNHASVLRNRLAEDDRNREAAGDLRARLVEQRRHHDLWKGMVDLIGSADGKKFRLFAQGLTLESLLGLANAHLFDLAPRYLLQRAPGGDLDLQVVDRDMADEVRGVASLSGGERFLVSLSLALGLASMTGGRTITESLFIDEGFGALDGESLDIAISALESLHATGRKVGVISHVQPMIDRIGVQIRIHKLGGGRSALEVRTD